MNFENMWSIHHGHSDIVYVFCSVQSSPWLYELFSQLLDHRHSYNVRCRTYVYVARHPSHVSSGQEKIPGSENHKGTPLTSYPSGLMR